MNYRKLGKSGLSISEISLGTWQVGGKWGEPFDQKNAEKIIHEAIDAGVNFIDTADVYSEGLSEATVAKVVKERREEVYLATKCGRRIQPHIPSQFSPEKLVRMVEDSLRNMKVDTIDLIQLHCPPTEIYDRPEYFEIFDQLKQDGKIKHLGVSVEKVEEARKAISYPNVVSVQIIFNMFRLKPAEAFFSLAAENDIGIIARVPLASGLLSGKMSEKTTFGKDDHRHFNRQGEAFDKGETFSGVDFHQGLKAVDALKEVFKTRKDSLALMALRWVLMFPEVSTVIAGASSPEQVTENVKASEIPALNAEELQEVQHIYDQYLRANIHKQW